MQIYEKKGGIEMTNFQYKLDPTNQAIVLGWWGVEKGKLNDYEIDLTETPLVMPDDPSEREEILKTIEEELKTKGLIIKVSAYGQTIYIQMAWDKDSGIPYQAFLPAEEESRNEYGNPSCEEEEECPYEPWDEMFETFEDYVASIIGEDYQLTLLRQIIPDGSGDEYRNS